MYLAVAFFVTLPILAICHFESVEIPKVLLISFDGFRWDYMDKFKAKDIPNLMHIRDNGVYARQGIKNVFTSKTFPNHFSIVTGLYEESHGIVANVMFDPVLNRSFSISNTQQTTHSEWFDNGGEPIWVTNQKHDAHRQSGSAFWPGSVAPIKGRLPSKYLLFNTNLPQKAKIDTVINWFTDEQPINLGLLYFKEPDHTAHSYGPDSDQVRSVIIEQDALLGYLLRKLKDVHLLEKLNIIVTSDHGMVSTPAENTIYLDDYSDMSLYRIVGGSIIVSIIPNDGHLDEVYQMLKSMPHCDVYKKQNIPAEYHYRNNRRIMPIIVVAHEGYTIHQRNDTHFLKANHGYNNSLPSMHPFFLAYGPAFKRKYSIRTFESIDIYPMLCHILGLTPAPNNGSLERVKYLLRAVHDNSHTGGGIILTYFVIVPLCLSLCAVLSVAAFCQYRITRRRYTNNFRDTSFTKLSYDQRAILSESEEEFP